MNIRILLPLYFIFFSVIAVGQTAEAYTWANAPIGGGGYITGMKIHPLDATKRYYRADVGGAYRYDASSDRMVQMVFFPEKNFYSVAGIALHPTDTDLVYLAVGRNCDPNKTAILRSTDGGVSFEAMAIPNIPFWFAANGGRECDTNNDNNAPNTGDKDRQGTPLEVNPHNTNELYIGTREKGLYILDVNTLNLTQVTAIPENTSQYSIRSVVFPPTMQRVFVAYQGHGVYVGYGNQGYTHYGFANHQELQKAIDVSISRDANYLLVACKTEGIMKATNLTGTLSWELLTGLNNPDDEGYLTALTGIILMSFK